MDLRGLIIFLEAAELGSFTRAGEKLGYSQPTVSFQIKQLEKELGVKLFDRIGHTVALTDAGRDARNYAREICRMYQQMLQADDTREPQGQLRLGMADSLCEPLIARHFGRFRRDYPGVAVELVMGDTGELLRLLDHNEVDMICTMDDHVYDCTYCIAQEEVVELHFVTAAGDPLAEKEEVALEELLLRPFFLTEKGMSYRRMMDNLLAQTGRQVRPVLETGQADLICRLVEQDLGVSFLPDYVTQEGVDRGLLARLNVPEVSLKVWKQVLYRQDKWLSPPMKAMLRHLSAIRLNQSIHQGGERDVH